MAAAAIVSCGGAPATLVGAPILPTRPVVLIAPSDDARQTGLADIHGAEPLAHTTLCPPETHWDGLACAHARATCGGWDGSSCHPSSASPAEQERAARDQFARIDRDAQTVCPEHDESRQVYQGNAFDVVKAMEMAIARADQIYQRLAQLRDAQQTPQWDVATFARIGSLYDCVWNSVRQSTPASYFTPQQQALLAKLNNVANQLNTAGQAGHAQQIQQQIAGTAQAVAQKWADTRDRYLERLSRNMVSAYVPATLLARRFALEGFSFTRASERLPIVASILGDERMGRLLEDMADPTDQEPDQLKRRHLIYIVGAFRTTP